MRILTITLTSLLALNLAGCAMTTAGVKKGDERNFARSMNDISAERAIKARFRRAHDFDLSKVDIEVAEGVVVLTGFAPTMEDRIEAERIAWSGPTVLQVGNEIADSSTGGLFKSAGDAALGTAVRTRLMADNLVKARNVNIETRNGVVYLLGVARTPQELERMAQIASTTRGAKEVVSYVTLAGADVTSASWGQPASAINNTTGAQPFVAPQRQLPDFLTPAPGGVTATPHSPTMGVPSVQAPSVTTPPVATPQLPSNLTPVAPPSVAKNLPPVPKPGEPYYRDPVTGKRIQMPEGVKPIPYNPGEAQTPSAPHYLNPQTGQAVKIIHYGQ